MKEILIIGGGAMGSAFTIPCLENKNNVTITEPYSKQFINNLKSKNKFHSVLKIKLPKKLKFRIFSKELLKEKFNWDDGEVQDREWTITKIDEHNYEGTAGDVVGKAIGYSYGPAFKFEYVLLVPVKGKELKITFDDWIFKQDERVAINRATMTKFGFKVAELTVVFVKD